MLTGQNGILNKASEATSGGRKDHIGTNYRQ